MKREFGIFGITRDTLLGGHQFIRAIGESKIGISFNRMNDIEWYASDRIVQLAGNGCLVFTPRIPGFEKLFAKDEVVYFDSLADLPNLLRAYCATMTAEFKLPARDGCARIKVIMKGESPALSLSQSSAKNTPKIMNEKWGRRIGLINPSCCFSFPKAHASAMIFSRSA